MWASIERAGVDTPIRTKLDKIDEMTAIGEKLRKSVRLSCLRGCDGRGFAASRRHLPKSSGPFTEHDDVLAIPGASSSVNDVGQKLWHTTDDVDAFQLPIREESYRRAVRRPKWIRPSVRSRQRLCRHGI